MQDMADQDEGEGVSEGAGPSRAGRETTVAGKGQPGPAAAKKADARAARLAAALKANIGRRKAAARAVISSGDGEP